MRISAPAKVNFSLKVLGKRTDGFHEIETLIVPISLADEIVIEKQSRWIDLECDDPSIPHGAENLVTQAAKAFLKRTGQKTGLSIKLQKRIPHGAGLGGGSSDAAATLLALNEMFETRLTGENLAEMAAKLGSDVPFFLLGSPAVCSGRGEVVRPVSLPAKIPLLLLKPEFGVATPQAYASWSKSKQIPEISYAPQRAHGQTLVNDLERPVFGKFVFLAQLKMWLLQQAEVEAALMSGSGSAVFAVLKEANTGQALGDRAREMLDPKLWTFECETIG